MDNVEIDEALVRSLLSEQHPDLSGLGLQRVAAGWDNQMWRLGEELAVRMPRTPRAPALLAKERQWLPRLAARLPLPVPTPIRFGEASAIFRRPWTIARWVPGEPADRATISRVEHAADALAGFLRALHQEAPAEAPVNPGRGVALATFAHDAGPKLQAFVPDGIVADVQHVWEAAVSAPEWAGPPVWLHGDLHPANVVVSGGTIAGVIDFGELCAGDPANDLAAAWLLLPTGGAARFLDTYEIGDAAMVRRARGWAVLHAASLISIGQAWERGLPGGQPTWGRAGRLALERVLADC
ncbi:aminoglycoside phosphotransferase family protein [Nocardia sp. NPDC050175]|uniref:aminoglycoside phosphotransferase family protein n=1 Tax=Nocardia sp. NPDC050175 TaxID=3364317 RepID=UPI00379C8ED0